MSIFFYPGWRCLIVMTFLFKAWQKPSSSFLQSTHSSSLCWATWLVTFLANQKACLGDLIVALPVHASTGVSPSNVVSLCRPRARPVPAVATQSCSRCGSQRPTGDGAGVETRPALPGERSPRPCRCHHARLHGPSRLRAGYHAWNRVSVP